MSPHTHANGFANGLQTKHKVSTPSPDSSPDMDFLDLNKSFHGSTESSPDLHLEHGAAEEELALLRAENAELRGQMEEAEKLLQTAATNEEAWLDRQKEYEQLLEEKSEVIRGLHHKIQELQEKGPGKNLAQVEELEQIQKELEEQRLQLEEDEKSLMAQMRNMEMSLSRDRAELARQRNEIQRLHADLTREIEMNSRDPGLRERLANLRRDVAGAKAGGSQAPPSQAQAAPEPRPAIPEPPKKNSGLFRRIFGGGE